MEAATNRLEKLAMQFSSCSSASEQQALHVEPCRGAVKSLPFFDTYTMECFIDDQREMKAKVYALFKQQPDLLPSVEEGLTKEEHRALVRRQLRALLAAGFTPLEYFARDLKAYFYLAECLSMVDLSLMVKSGVQYSLWGGSVLNLGTEGHRRKYFDDIAAFRLPGCFAMTELKHGSNVAGLQTEAVLDVLTDEWVIHTPDDGAIKWWIGNAAEDGRMATVFARLKVPETHPAMGSAAGGGASGRGATAGSGKGGKSGGKASAAGSKAAPVRKPGGGPGPAASQGGLVDHGVHAFLVPIRDAQGALMPGVEIRDCGYKVGLNGVDNGAIRFTYVRVPRTNLLDRFGTVDKSGRYSSPLTSQSRRFAATLGELTGGRVGLCSGSVGALKGALTIAIRYAAQRQQFGPPDAAEVSVLDYQSTQAKLMPLLATAYGLHFAKAFLVERYTGMKRAKGDAKLVEEVHALSAGLKAYTTSYTQAALGVCREACGGHGYAAVNRLGALRSDHDIFLTFEGDNTVLLQQVTALLLKEYRHQFSGAPISSTLHFLTQLAASSLPNNPLVTHETDPRHLRDPAFLSKALEYRTARMLFTLSLRLRKHTPRLGAFAAWNKCLSHVLDLANAYIESVIHKCMLKAAESCVDADCRAALCALADTFALHTISQDILFRNEEYIAPSKAKAIQRLLVELYSELRGVAVPLVNAFAIPDHILRAPIAIQGGAGVADMYKEYLLAAGFDV